MINQEIYEAVQYFSRLYDGQEIRTPRKTKKPSKNEANASAKEALSAKAVKTPPKREKKHP